MHNPLSSVKHDQYYTRPTVVFPASEHHRSLAGTKLILLDDARLLPKHFKDIFYQTEVHVMPEYKITKLIYYEYKILKLFSV